MTNKKLERKQAQAESLPCFLFSTIRAYIFGFSRIFGFGKAMDRRCLFFLRVFDGNATEFPIGNEQINKNIIRKGVTEMAPKRRKCTLANKSKTCNLKHYEKEIISVVNQTIPGKNPKVYATCFSTDELTQREAVLLGRALAKIDGLKELGKKVTIFRLFDGKLYESEEATKPIQKKEKE